MGIIIARILITALAFLFAAYLIPGIIVSNFYSAIILAFFWGLINLTLKPFLFILTLPINIFTFGFFTIVLNGFFLWLLSIFIKGFGVDGFVTAMLGALVITGVSWVGNKAVRAIK